MPKNRLRQMAEDWFDETEITFREEVARFFDSGIFENLAVAADLEEPDTIADINVDVGFIEDEGLGSISDDDITPLAAYWMLKIPSQS